MKFKAISFAAALGFLVVAVYNLGLKEGGKDDSSQSGVQEPEKSIPAAAQAEPPAATPTPPPAAATGAGKLPENAVLTPNHPPINNMPRTVANGQATPPPANQNVKFTHFRVGNRNVKSIFVDKDIIWVGTSGGVIRYEPATDDYRLFDVRNGLLANGVFHVSRWKENKMLVGTYGGGLAVYDEVLDKFEIFNVPDGLADAFVYDVQLTPNGDMWIATWSGANRVLGGRLEDPAAWETYTVENTNGGLPNDWVYGLDLGVNDDVWFATEGGLSHYKDGKWKSWNHKDGQGAIYDLVKNDNQFDTDPAKVSSHHARQKIEMGLEDISTAYNPNYIVALEVDHEGVVWVGTWGGGLARFDGNSFTNYTVQDGLASNHVFMLHEDDNQVLWVGTSNGMSKFDRKTFKNMTRRDGLYNNAIFSMDTQKDNTLWVGSFGGVARILLNDSP